MSFHRSRIVQLWSEWCLYDSNKLRIEIDKTDKSISQTLIDLFISEGFEIDNTAENRLKLEAENIKFFQKAEDERKLFRCV